MSEPLTALQIEQNADEDARRWLTPERARWVRVLRVDLQCTWRRVTELCIQVSAKDTDKALVAWYPAQIIGRCLCDQAAGMLCERWDTEDTAA